MNSPFLIGCSKAKRTYACPAERLYLGDLFRKASALADAIGGSWFILSAKHGLVDPRWTLEPYDLALADLSAAERAAWGERVRAQLAGRGLSALRLTVLAGRAYRDALGLPDAAVEAPMAGLGIGQQKAWLARELAARAEAG